MKVNPNFVFRNIYGKFILMPVRKNDASDDPILLNSVAADIWKLAERVDSSEGIISSILRKYDLQKDSMEEASVAQFISLLVEQKLLLE